MRVFINILALIAVILTAGMPAIIIGIEEWWDKRKHKHELKEYQFDLQENKIISYKCLSCNKIILQEDNV